MIENFRNLRFLFTDWGSQNAKAKQAKIIPIHIRIKIKEHRRNRPKFQ